MKIKSRYIQALKCCCVAHFYEKSKSITNYNKNYTFSFYNNNKIQIVAKMHLQLRTCAALSEDTIPLPSSYSSISLVIEHLRPLPKSHTCTHMHSPHICIIRNILNLLKYSYKTCKTCAFWFSNFSILSNISFLNLFP